MRIVSGVPLLLAAAWALPFDAARAGSPPPSLTSPGFTPPPVVGAPRPPPAAPKDHGPTPGATGDEAALAATTVKFNAYVEYMNRTLRAMDSLDRYRSWVNMRSGPTGRERIIYGLYGVYDTARERAAATAAIAAEPHLPDLDGAMRDYIVANENLAPVLNEANGYYERADYKVDHMAQGKMLHARIVAAAGPFVAARARLEKVMRVEKGQVDAIRLATVEKHEGRSARWHVADVMMHAERTIDALKGGEHGAVDLAAFNGAMASFGTAVKSLDDYKAGHPDAFSGFASFPDSMLGRLRDVQERLGRTHGNLRRAAGLDMTFIMSDYNTMVSIAPTATQFGER